MSDLPPLHDVVEIASEIGLDALAALAHENSKEKGFWPDRYYVKLDNLSQVSIKWPPKHITDEALMLKLALIHSEVSEVLEAVRKEKGKEEVEKEFADIIIRTVELYAALLNTGQVDSSLDDVVQLKMKENTLRPRKHGNRF
jgi:NTP pyrophosphatase (non-canonical NTP hydrolase)